MNLNELRRSYNDNVHKVERLKAERESLMSLLEVSGIDYSMDKVQTSPSDKIAEIVAKILDKDAEIVEAVGDCELTQEKMLAEIKKIPDEESVTILINRYVMGIPWQEIADSMNYSRSTILRKAYKALKQIEG